MFLCQQARLMRLQSSIHGTDSIHQSTSGFLLIPPPDVLAPDTIPVMLGSSSWSHGTWMPPRPPPEAWISALISHIQSLPTPADIIFLQEVSRSALLVLLAMPWLREHFYTSEADTTNWGKQSFASMTLVSRLLTDLQNTALGPIWRVKYPRKS